MRKPLVLTLVAALLLVLVAAPAVAEGTDSDDSVLVRVDGDVTVPAGEAHGIVVVIDGDLDFEGTATTIVVVSGKADLVGATVETLVVVDGVADLGADTRVTGDVHLIESDIFRSPTATVEGSIESGTGDFSRGFWLLGFLFMLGWAVMTILAGLVLAAVAPQFARRTGRTITTNLGPTVVSGLVLWIVVPIVGIILFATLIGIPTALTIWFALMPAMALIGLLVAGVRVGEYITGGTEGIGHPYLAALTGTVALVIAGAIPFVGPIVIAVAGFLGSGALALHAFRAMSQEPSTPAPPAPVPPAPTTN